MYILSAAVGNTNNINKLCCTQVPYIHGLSDECCVFKLFKSCIQFVTAGCSKWSHKRLLCIYVCYRSRWVSCRQDVHNYTWHIFDDVTQLCNTNQMFIN